AHRRGAADGPPAAPGERVAPGRARALPDPGGGAVDRARGRAGPGQGAAGHRGGPMTPAGPGDPAPESLADLTAHELAGRFAGGQATAVQATEAALARIAAHDELRHRVVRV